MQDDRLQQMIEMQADLQRIMPPHRPFPSPDPEVLMEQIRNNVLALFSELNEAMDETGWKPWASSNHIFPAAFAAEMVDAWHFFMNLMILGGVTADDLHQGYLAKHAKNRARQAEGYDGVSTKCPQCKRAYDDPAVLCEPLHGNNIKGIPAWCSKTGQYS
jgi:hypothetical protein